MTLTIPDAAFGLAESICIVVLAGGFAVLMVYSVLVTVMDGRVDRRDAEILALRDERHELGMALAAAKAESLKRAGEVETLTARVKDAVAILNGELELENDES